MIAALPGPLIVSPERWTVVFNREASCRWAGLLAFGRYKHVRAYAYVPFLHVWVFFDPHLRGTEIIVAADGAPAQALIQQWIVNADLVSVRRQCRDNVRTMPLLGFCVPAIRRLLGIPGHGLRPDSFHRDCLAAGGDRFLGALRLASAGATVPPHASPSIPATAP